MSVNVEIVEQSVTVVDDTGAVVVTETPVIETVEIGVQGAQGIQGAQGVTGQGVPVGGTTGQVLAKVSAADYDTEWQDTAGAVDSVNGQTGVVVLDADDIDAVADKNYVTDAQLTVISNTSNTNTGDNATNSLYSGLVTNATHTGDATGATALTLATVNANVGSFGSASQVAGFTANAKGLITAANSTPIQIAQSQVTGLATDLLNKQPLATVLTNTTAAFTTTLETKLSGIAAGAEVNVNADWNAGSGDAQILNKPTLGTAAAQDVGYFATSAQGTLADSALQSGDNITELTNNANYIAAAGAPVQSVNGQTGVVVLDADDVNAVPYTGATGNVDLGANNLTTTGDIEAQVLRTATAVEIFDPAEGAYGNIDLLDSYYTFRNAYNGNPASIVALDATFSESVVASNQSLVNTVASAVVAVVRGAVSQTADLQQWQNSSGTILGRVFAAGGMQVPSIEVTGGDEGTSAGLYYEALQYGFTFNSGGANGASGFVVGALEDLEYVAIFCRDEVRLNIDGVNETNTYSALGGHVFNNNVSITGTASATGNMSAANLSGTNTGDRHNYFAPISGRFIRTDDGTSTTTTTRVGTANRIFISPFVPQTNITFDQLSINVTAAIALAEVAIVIYSSNADGKPNALLFESGSLVASTTGIKNAAVSPNITLVAGTLYWFGVKHSLNPTLSAGQLYNTLNVGNQSTVITSQAKTLLLTHTFANPAPATWTFAAGQIQNNVAAAMVWMRVA